MAAPTASEIQLEGGTYEVLKNRLEKSANQLTSATKKLDERRKEVFGGIETRLISAERITTAHNCVPRDMVPIGEQFIFGYNVHLGLKTHVELEDVFSFHAYRDHHFPILEKPLLQDEQFISDFEKLYKYYKNTQFSRFDRKGPHLYMVFQIGKTAKEIKAFKWLVSGDGLTYLDNRSDHEVRPPEQYAFRWKRTNREAQRLGEFSHISVEDQVFVEVSRGRLTLKVEDNTDSGQGIFVEEVEQVEQSLDDVEVQYSLMGNLVLLKIKPYLEKTYRYYVFNRKLQEAQNIPALAQSCILLPEDQGIMFPNGYYLQNGAYKLFDSDLGEMRYQRMIPSPNGEDYLYIFYQPDHGIYQLLPYNLISQQVETPIMCHGYAIFDNGELCFFNSDEEPKKHHATKIWQTPFTGPDFQSSVRSDSYLFKIGNKELVRALSECNELLTLVAKGENYEGLYVDLQKLATDITDSYHWLGHEESGNLLEPLSDIRQTSELAIEEYEKVVSIKKNTSQQLEEVTERITSLLNKISRESQPSIEKFVANLASLRTMRGELETLKTLRYIDEATVQSFQEKLADENQRYAERCVVFLLREDALRPYEKRIEDLEQEIIEVSKVVDADTLGVKIAQVSEDLEMLIEIVGNLKIADATQTTQIIDNISLLFSRLNQGRATLNNQRRSLLRVEGEAEFNAQIKLIEQGLTNFLDLSDTPEKCDEYLAKLMVQLEELEAKFVEFDDFIEKISEKREQVYSSFDTRKVSLIEAKNRRANSLQTAANRILSAAKNRTLRMKSEEEVNTYFTSDLMVEKLRTIVADLQELGDTIKADDLQGKMKSLREDALRQLRDKNELFADSDQVIKFGKYHFSVNTQPMEVTVVRREEQLWYHLTGTSLYEAIPEAHIGPATPIWEQELVSENAQVYRAEYLAYQLLKAADAPDVSGISVDGLIQLTPKQLEARVQEFMAVRYNEGYVKGIHDHDAAKLLTSLLIFFRSGDLLKYAADARAFALYFWEFCLEASKREALVNQITGLSSILDIFPDSRAYHELIASLTEQIAAVRTGEFERTSATAAANYLFHELSNPQDYSLSENAAALAQAFNDFLKQQKGEQKFAQSLELLPDATSQFALVVKWLSAFVAHTQQADDRPFIREAAFHLTGKDLAFHTLNLPMIEEIGGLLGTHGVIHDGNYHMNFNEFLSKLDHFEQAVVPAYQQFQEGKRKLVADFSTELRISEFQPRVMASFVRNKLINDVYLPLIGANLAKQIGEVGEGKRTDLMGMLLLVSPPGYGKTTLMEYIANRLGLIFMKINGPALGHELRSLDPADAPNAAAREEVNKLNLSFEMGDNVMIYLDDIQHCHPEFLQKFISLCDAQRKIEGVYKGQT
ncbi:MAG: DNA repair ATPase, partial [Bacteroidota bacterium]